jgi:hypothetical protein
LNEKWVNRNKKWLRGKYYNLLTKLINNVGNLEERSINGLIKRNIKVCIRNIKW